MNEYEYHIFFSYKRERLTLDWHRKVVDLIKLYVRNSLNIGEDGLKIFFDEKEIETGNYFEEDISQAIRTSMCMVAIWTPDYFHSNWCLSEFHSFLKRQESLANKLIIPASFHDGINFPAEAKAIQFEDFTDYASPIKAFWDTSDAVEFAKKLRNFSENIASKIRRAPEFDANFPFLSVKNEKATPFIKRMNK